MMYKPLLNFLFPRPARCRIIVAPYPPPGSYSRHHPRPPPPPGCTRRPCHQAPASHRRLCTSAPPRWNWPQPQSLYLCLRQRRGSQHQALATHLALHTADLRCRCRPRRHPPDGNTDLPRHCRWGSFKKRVCVQNTEYERWAVQGVAKSGGKKN